MLGNLFNPFSLSVLAFFPLIAWQGGLAGLAGPARSGEGALQRRVGSSSVAPPSGWGQPSRAGGELDPLMVAAQPILLQLQRLGAQYLRVEQVERGTAMFYRCRCEMASGPGQSTSRSVEADGADPQSAALGVLNRVLAQAPLNPSSPWPSGR